MNDVRTWLDRPRTIKAPSLAPGGGSSRIDQGQPDGLRVPRPFSMLRLLFELLVHPWTIALVNAAILLVLVLGFLYMLHTGMEPLHQAEEIISGLGVILIGWGVAQYPYLVRPELTIVNSAAPSNIVSDLVIAVAVGAVVLIPSLILLLLVFKTNRNRYRPSHTQFRAGVYK